MQPKFKVGDLVKFKEKEFEIPSPIGLSVKLDSDKFGGKVTAVADLGPDGYEYTLDVYVHGVIWSIKAKEDQITSLKDYVCDVIDAFVKKASLGITEKTAKELSELVNGLRNGPEIRSRVLPTYNPEHNSWLKDMIKKWEKDHPLRFDFIDMPLLRDPKRYILNFDLGREESKPEPKKMEKSRCIKLLESYRAEREKVKKGRRFERCLRDSVVDEALERAIELLKGGES